MPKTRHLNIDVVAVNEKFIRNKGRPDYRGLSPASVRLLQQSRFTAAEINAAYAEARAIIRAEAGCPDPAPLA